jgi:hypothetical protein
VVITENWCFCKVGFSCVFEILLVKGDEPVKLPSFLLCTQ